MAAQQQSTSVQLQAIGNFTIEELQTMKHTLAKDASIDQFNLFVRTAAAAGLNPFLNHIYCIIYGGKMSIQISVEGITFLAKRVEGYQGIDVQLVYEGDEFKAKRVRDESTGRYYWDVEHEMTANPGKVIGCYALAYRDGFSPVYEYLKVDEVDHHLSGNNAANWKKYFNDFFKKTVVKRAAKRQYGIEISEDEAPASSGDVQAYEPRRVDITDEANAVQSEPAATPEKTQEDKEAKEIKAVRAKISTAFKKLGITDDNEKIKYMNDNITPKGDSPSLQEWKALLKVMEMDIEEKESGGELDPILV
ncbi:RecT family recombinase [Paenibacillus sp. Marseille-Q4541]|uniref:RecT family recombinase n=1 Tax=Paenibacillus sp. Marseille-Q4541 TaxID=2831522 RepID=UPI001BA4B99F|nr:RecT family recombinase [Paenibacillus sp. Marseille-Q4541]